MGAAVSQPQSALTAAASAGKAQPGADPFFAELGGEVHYDRSMGSSRFLKAVRGRHRQGALVVKVFVKQDPSISLKPFVRRLKAEREALADCPNVQAYGRAIETERAGYLMRQWVASNLYDRISTRPFLSSVEKRWIAFQLLTGLKHARERGISHGDIKTENVVVTSWNWVYLTDFSSAFKPTHLPLDDPSEFSFYFDTSSRRTCYIAPERFYSSDSDIAKTKESLEIGKRDGKITEAMDVFSLGCVLAELWMEGTPPFTLSQLFKYRQGEYSLESYLAEIEDIEIRSLIRSMVSLDPSSRLSFSDYLNQYRGTAFPEIFYTFLHPFLSALTDSASSSAPPPVPNRPGTATPVTGDGAGLAARQEHTLLRTDADDKIERVWTEWEIVARYLDETLPNEDLQKGAESSDERQKNRLPAEVLAIAVQVGGASLAATAGGKSLFDIGCNIMLAGIILQLVLTVVFLAAVVAYFTRLRRATEERVLNVRNRIGFLFWGVVVMDALIIIRGAYRTAELTGGIWGPIATSQIALILGDAVPMLLVVYGLNATHTMWTVVPFERAKEHESTDIGLVQRRTSNGSSLEKADAAYLGGC